ncbi:helix-turn-helix domain-containing protein [Miltoncostaea oceani]|jgi:predicted ArsR family transcriptional regulator|uniref:helix-turn-helix domain-containing protein n=1 Tax=Miltoncostaea oceani TaxID=2843216 RepID=UPI001C3D5617|nr:helix-turn-helix domain-containing protein [Miltoncostaea oceani]
MGAAHPPGAVDALTPARHARAASLARPAARRVAAALEAARRPVTAQELADALGRHHTGVRVQLRALERAGVVEGVSDPPRRRGRPTRRYTLTSDPGEREAAGHRELVRLLMGLVRQTGLGPGDVERFGERQGWAVPAPGGGADELRWAFERLGFAPRWAAVAPLSELVLDQCPFADGVEAPGGEVICLMHRGLARGIARRACPGLAITELVIEDPRRAGCRLRLGPADGPAIHHPRESP